MIPRGIISSDGHVCEPPNCYVDYIDPKYRDDAPRILAQPASTPARPVAVGPRVSVVVVNYRQWDDTAELVRQLRAAPLLRRGAAEVVIVDNHSPPDPDRKSTRLNSSH